MPTYWLNNDFPVDPSTTLVAVADATTGLLTKLGETLVLAYGIGTKPPSAERVHYQLVLLPNGSPGVRIAVPLELADGGALLRAELQRQQRVAALIKQAAANPGAAS